MEDEEEEDAVETNRPAEEFNYPPMGDPLAGIGTSLRLARGVSSIDDISDYGPLPKGPLTPHTAEVVCRDFGDQHPQTLPAANSAESQPDFEIPSTS